MKQLVKKSVKARDLPKEWQERERFDPDSQVTVWIQPDDDPDLAGAQSLSDIMDAIGAEAERRGLTQEKLDEILEEAKREART